MFEEKRKEKFEEFELSTGETVKIISKKLSIKPGKIPFSFSPDKNREYISADNTDEKFHVRRWKNGDRFYPIGLKGSKKVSDFLNDQKINNTDKEKQLVLTSRGKIVWVIGLRLDDRFKVTNNTQRILELCLN